MNNTVNNLQNGMILDREEKLLSKNILKQRLGQDLLSIKLSIRLDTRCWNDGEIMPSITENINKNNIIQSL